MNLLKFNVLVGFLSVLTPASGRAAETPLTLVRDGQAMAVIIVPAAPNASALSGAKELQLHLRKMTGADVPIVADRADGGANPADAGVNKVRIMVGESRATRQLGISASDYTDQEYSLQQKDNAIILLGHDVTEGYPTVFGGSPLPYAKGRFGGAMAGWACIGVKDHGFNDDHGTMECFVYVAPTTNEASTGWMILRVGDEQNGHLLQTRSDKVAKKNFLVYETYVNGQANKIEVKVAWWDRKPGWHHVMASWDAAANKAEVFLNGMSVGTAPYAKTSCNNAPFFSVRGDGNNIPNCFGPVDEVRLSKVVRKPTVPTKLYKTDDDTLALLHFDDPQDLFRDNSDYQRSDPLAVLALWDQTNPANYQHLSGLRPTGAGGTLYAVYDFLERHCGVRWYAPTDEGMVCPETKTLVVAVETRRRTPAFLFRGATGGPNGWGLITEPFGEGNPPDRVLFNDRLKMGGKPWLLSHTFEAWPDRFWEKNPANPDAFEERRENYFFVNPDGSRNKEQLCFSNPGTLEQVIKDARAWFNEGKATTRSIQNADFYAIGPRDTALYTCSCEDCKKGCEAAGTNWPNTFNNGKASEIYYAFLNKVQAAIDQSNPGKHIASFNYMDYVYYPKTLDVNTNIYTGFAQCWSSVSPYERKEMLDCYAPWRKKMSGRNQVCIWRYDGWFWEFPELRNDTKAFPLWCPYALADEIRMFARDGARGLFYCGLNRYFDGWLNLKLLDDPELDVDYELDYFFTHYYGSAAAPMRAIYDTIHASYSNNPPWPIGCELNRPGGLGGADGHWYYMGRPAIMEKLGRLMDEAKAKADTELAKRRVAAYERDIWQNHMLAAYNKYTASQPTKKHPYPFMPPLPLVSGRDPVPGAPAFLERAFMRNGGPGIGVWETGFNDKQGTMEAWVQIGPFHTNSYWHGNGLLFEIEGLDSASGHRVQLKPAFGKKVLLPIYETWAGGRTNTAKGKPIPAPKASQWYHVSASWGIASSNGPLAAILINNKVSGRSKYRETACKGRLFTAGWPSTTMSCFGAIDEVRLSNIVRKPSAQKAPHQTDANTLLLLHFDDEPGQPATLAKIPPARVIFVCSGNFYRSRFAEEYFNATAKKKGLSCYSESRGTLVDPTAAPGEPGMSPETVTQLEKRGITPVGTNLSRRAMTPHDVTEFDLFVALNGEEHLPAMAQAGYPPDRTLAWDIRDGVTVVEEEFPRLVKKIDELLEE